MFLYRPAQRKQPAPTRYLAGVGMIEILVTLFILSIGLLGVAYLQFVGSFTNSESLSRSQSVLIAQQLSERLRGSAYFSVTGDGLIVDNDYFDTDIYNFNNLSCNSGGLPYNCYCLTRPSVIPNCTDSVCTAAQMAVVDAYDVSCAAVNANPDIEISLSCEDNDLTDTTTCSVGSKHIIKVSWPVEKWQNIDRTLNAVCNEDRLTPYDCVTLDVTL